jgi:serine/threonine protein kinase
VQYAHRRLVVHRDLKAANILVTSDGEVKLLTSASRSCWKRMPLAHRET